MSFVHLRHAGDQVILDVDEGLERAEALQASYRSAAPFPHAVLDDFLAPPLADRLVDVFPPADLATVRRRGRHQNLKRGYRPESLGLHPSLALLQAFNTAPVLNLLEALTGHSGLLPDPHFTGGGFHETEGGGHLAIHADFNLHPRLGLRRRINLIVFLNREWDDAWGGALELWDRGMTGCVASVAPRFNRAVVFDTDRTSFHGHPDPLRCPPGRTRRSLAAYYYTPPGADDGPVDVRTDWRPRPGQDAFPEPESRARRLLRRAARFLQGR